jgi:hypothetical protein
VLLIAAAFKGHSLLTDFAPGKTVLLSRPVQFATVEVEMALGLWLLSGQGLLWAARVGAVFFVTLAGASAWLLASGAECCGCLGRLAVSPWFSFTFNLAAVCALALVPKPPPGDEPSRPGVALALSCVFVFFGVLLPIVGWKEPIPASQGRGLGVPGELVLLDTETWPGRHLPVLDFIDIAGRLRKGGWTLIFHHRDCPKCEQLIADAASRPKADASIVLVEVPVLASDSEGKVPPPRGPFLSGRLAAARRWVIETPKVIRIEDGVVVGADNGLGGPGVTLSREK